MVVAASTLTVVAVGIAKLSSLALGLLTRLVFGLAAAPVAADQHLAAAGAAGGIDLGGGELDVLAGHHDGAALVPFFLPAADSVPEILMVCVGAPAGLLAPVAALSTIMPLRRPIELALITPLVLMTESTTARAAAAVSSTRPPFARSLPSLLTSDLSGWPVETSITFEAIWSPTASVISLSPYMSRVKLLPEASADGAERGGDGAGVAHARRDQRREAAARRGDPAVVDDRGVRPARDVEVVAAGHEVGVLDVVGGGEEARGVDHGAGAEQDAVAVDEEDAAVGGQVPRISDGPSPPVTRLSATELLG